MLEHMIDYQDNLDIQMILPEEFSPQTTEDDAFFQVHMLLTIDELERQRYVAMLEHAPALHRAIEAKDRPTEVQLFAFLRRAEFLFFLTVASHVRAVQRTKLIHLYHAWLYEHYPNWNLKQRTRPEELSDVADSFETASTEFIERMDDTMSWDLARWVSTQITTNHPHKAQRTVPGHWED